jgi:hypothetical protein
MARQQYPGEKFKPTKGAFGGTSKYNRRLKEQAKLKAQIAEMEEKKKQEEAKKAEKPAEKKPATKKPTTKKTKQENAGNSTE